jgi:hypothetical protein
MVGACSTYGNRGELRTGFGWENLRERDQLEDISVDGKIMLNWILMN